MTKFLEVDLYLLIWILFAAFVIVKMVREAQRIDRKGIEMKTVFARLKESDMAFALRPGHNNLLREVSIC